jgi:hypothetical protein
MQTAVRDLNTVADPAKTKLSLQPVYPAVARAAFATRQLLRKWSIHITIDTHYTSAT